MAMASCLRWPGENAPRDALTDGAKHSGLKAPRETVPALATVSTVLLPSCPVGCSGGRPPRCHQAATAPGTLRAPAGAGADLSLQCQHLSPEVPLSRAVCNSVF